MNEMTVIATPENSPAPTGIVRSYICRDPQCEEQFESDRRLCPACGNDDIDLCCDHCGDDSLVDTGMGPYCPDCKELTYE